MSVENNEEYVIMSSMELGIYQGPQVNQQLNLAPQLLQWLRLLQAPTVELNSLVQTELESNPVLELDGDLPDHEVEAPEVAAPESDFSVDMDAAENISDTNVDARLEALTEIDNEWREDYEHVARTQRQSNPEDQKRHQFIIDSLTTEDSLQEHLLKQLAAYELSEREEAAAEWLIGSLDHRGYLATPVGEIAEVLCETVAFIERVLQRVQLLDPAGIGARTLAECLLLQLDGQSGRHDVARAIVSNYMEWIARGEFDALAEQLGVSREDIDDALDLLRTLNPEPGRTFTQQPVEYVTPDVFISREEDGFRVDLNDENIPHLSINQHCKSLLEKSELSSGDQTYIRRKLRRASFLIQGISQRQDTLRKVSDEILRVQYDFFDKDEGELKPLTMGKVANIIGVHETTVSRALANKYIETPRGLFEMKFFFRAGYRCSDGSAMTPDSVKEMIAGLVDEENETEPLTDLQIADLLKESKGLKLARRTVAKYRDELGIPASKVRVVA
ncbi:MAG: RNA polymerase sigma-54 factor [Spartobacteria bacterium]|nr:RNA polymerase sigma-54 factor [Spartobacteria bacterium]